MVYLVVRQSEDGYSLYTSDCKVFATNLAAIGYCAEMNKTSTSPNVDYLVIDYVVQ